MTPDPGAHPASESTEPLQAAALESASPIAVVDLGSNSFHMLVAETGPTGEVRVIDRLREMVRLAAGLDVQNTITPEAVARASACLERFGERLRVLPASNVRVVGTNTLRKARNSGEFVRRAEALLGHPIDIISGYEEARLIFQGVAHGLEDGPGRRLVIDIGGGSTEFILGVRYEPLMMESLHMGCVSMSERFFGDGAITPDAFEAAEIAARQELEGIDTTYAARGWDSAVGASGTILSVREVVKRAGWSLDGITRDSLGTLKAAMIAAGSIAKARFDGLSTERQPVFVGGVAVLKAAFDALGIEHMRVSDRALREGLLLDLVGRISHHDMREVTVDRVAERYGVDLDQAARVERLVATLVDGAAADRWPVPDDVRIVLAWAAHLHEIGLAISHSQYHKHGAYLLRNLDMPGFGRRDQTRLAALVRYHRRKFPADAFDDFPKEIAPTLKRACALLRIGIALARRRAGTELKSFSVKADGDTLKLRFDNGFLDAHPLTRADLAQEAAYLKGAGLKFKYK